MRKAFVEEHAKGLPENGARRAEYRDPGDPSGVKLPRSETIQDRCFDLLHLHLKQLNTVSSTTMLLLGFEIPLSTLFLGCLAATVLSVVVLFILFPDRAAFTPRMDKTPMAPGALPVIGHLLALPKYQVRYSQMPPTKAKNSDTRVLRIADSSRLYC